MHQDVRNVRRDCLVKRVFRLSNGDSLARVALWVGSRRRGSKMTCGKSVKIHCDGSTASGKVINLRGGEVAEWFKAHAWKACVANPYRGFESLPLRQIYFREVFNGCRILPVIHVRFAKSAFLRFLVFCRPYFVGRVFGVPTLPNPAAFNPMGPRILSTNSRGGDCASIPRWLGSGSPPTGGF